MKIEKINSFSLRTLSLAIPLLLSAFFVACEDVTPTTQRTITLSPSPIVLVSIGSTAQISVSSNGSTDAATFASLVASIATVDSNSGLVQGVSTGQTTITVSIAADATHSAAVATLQVFVGMVDVDGDGDDVIPTTQRTITLSPSPIVLVSIGSTAQISVSSNGSTDAATFASLVASIATVNSNSGLVQGVSTGQTTITVSIAADATHSAAVATLQVFVGMVDVDGDGLIEIDSLLKLHNMRYNLVGSSYKTSTDDSGVTGGCPNSGCFGYELITDLDFDADGDGSTWSGDSSNGYTLDTGDNDDVYFPIDIADSTSSSAGWVPIGDSTSSFTATFEGNDFTIKNLAIRSDLASTGFFGVINDANIRNIGLIDNLSDSINSGTEELYRNVGGLVAYSFDSTIVASYATGNVDGPSLDPDSTNIGGLVGANLGGRVIACYSKGNLYRRRISNAGGLVGRNEGTEADGGNPSLIIASYSTVKVNGEKNTGDYMGGLVGFNLTDGSVIASYSSGEVDASDNLHVTYVGGLIGNDQGGGGSGGVIKASYTLSDVHSPSGIITQVGLLAAVSSSEVQSPIENSYAFGTKFGNASDGRDGTDLPSGVSNATDLTGDNAGSNWNDAAEDTLGAWDFGTATDAPKLKFADYDGPDGDIYSCGGDGSTTTFSVDLCDTLIPGQ